MMKAFADLQLTPKLSADVDVIAASGVYARGNENNAHAPDGTYYLGPGTTPAYGIVNIGARYDLTRWLQVIAQVNNVFDARYYTASQLQATGFTGTGSYIARPFPPIGGEFPVQQATFYSPGAPTAYWIGTRIKF
jgi:outer membrane receptor protein involved in Fe transport